jgi:DNA-binding NarL/FixJ family response regulator
VVRVVVASAAALLADGIAAICERDGRFRVAAKCSDGQTALRRIQSEDAQIAVLDLDLPELHGLSILRRLRKEGRPVRVLLLAPRPDRKLALDGLRSGADGLVLTSDGAPELLSALECILEGKVFVSPRLKAAELFQLEPDADETDALELLTEREYEVFSLLAQGLRIKEVAQRLDISPRTVDTYRSSILRKLGVERTAGLVKLALQRKLIPWD